MRKVLSLFLAIGMCLSLCLPLCGCGKGEENNSIALTTENVEQYLSIVATYDNYKENNGFYTGYYYSWCDIAFHDALCRESD